MNVTTRGALWEQVGRLLLLLYQIFLIMNQCMMMMMIMGLLIRARITNKKKCCFFYFESVTGSCSMNHWINKQSDNHLLFVFGQSQSRTQTSQSITTFNKLKIQIKVHVWKDKTLLFLHCWQSSAETCHLQKQQQTNLLILLDDGVRGSSDYEVINQTTRGYANG